MVGRTRAGVGGAVTAERGLSDCQRCRSRNFKTHTSIWGLSDQAGVDTAAELELRDLGAVFPLV